MAVQKAKKPFLKYTTPVANFNYIHAVTPDTKFGPPTFSVTVQLNAEDGAKMVADVEKLMPKFTGQVPYKVNDAGQYEFKIKQKKFIEWFVNGEKQTKEATPVLLNSDNTPYTGTEPWSGSTGEVALIVDETRKPNGEAMMALRLKGIRFHEIVTGTGSGGGDPLFGNGSPAALPVDDGGDTEEEDDDAPFN